MGVGDASAEEGEEPPAVELAECPQVTGAALEDQPEAEIRKLREDLAAVCEALTSRLDAASAETAARHDALISALADLKTVEVRNADDPGLLAVEVTNPPDQSELKQVTDGLRQTVHRDLWALAGLAVGALLLFAIYRMVRP